MSVPYPVKVNLALLNGNMCAMESCRQPLLQRVDNDDILTGEVAHIAGKHGGGARGKPSARFDPKMTPQERDSLSNLLYLCETATL